MRCKSLINEQDGLFCTEQQEYYDNLNCDICLAPKIQTLQQENARLREGLEKIKKGRKIIEENGEYFDLYMEKEDMQNIAIELLQYKDKDNGK